MSSTASSGDSPHVEPSPKTANHGDTLKGQTPSKRRAARVSRACDFCHSRSIRCRQESSHSNTGTPPKCLSCIEYQRECTYDRPVKKRGVKSNTGRGSVVTSPTSGSWSKPSFSTGVDSKSSFRAADVLEHDTILDLIEMFFETIYPIFPYFHRPSLHRRVQDREYETNAPFFAGIMGMASLTIARVRDGATISDQWSSYDVSALPSSETLAQMAHTNIPKDAQVAENFDYLRAAAFLVLAALQNGLIEDMHMLMGLYHTYIRISGFKREDNWPKGISLIEIEERRRVFWSMYTVEVFSAVCFDTLISCREAQNRVLHPREIDDVRLDELNTAANKAGSPPSEYSSRLGQDPGCPVWLQGWNFMVDLYRVLEHAIDYRRQAENAPDCTSVLRLFGNQENNFDPRQITKAVMDSFNALPLPFKEIRTITFDQASDIFGFQAANISATMQLVRISLFDPSIMSLVECCQIVNEVIQTFAEVPIGYLKAISTPLTYHLYGLGDYLNSMNRASMPNDEYHRCRQTLLGLSMLLENLGNGTRVGDAPAKRLRDKVEKLDQELRGHRVESHNFSSPASFAPPVSYLNTSFHAGQQIPNGGSPMANSTASPPISALSTTTPTSPIASRGSAMKADNSIRSPPNPPLSNRDQPFWFHGEQNHLNYLNSHLTFGEQTGDVTSNGVLPASYATHAPTNGTSRSPYAGGPLNFADDGAWASDFGKATDFD